jgi:hypothetical protein
MIMAEDPLQHARTHWEQFEKWARSRARPGGQRAQGSKMAATSTSVKAALKGLTQKVEGALSTMTASVNRIDELATQSRHHISAAAEHMKPPSAGTSPERAARALYRALTTVEEVAKWAKSLDEVVMQMGENVRRTFEQLQKAGEQEPPREMVQALEETGRSLEDVRDAARSLPDTARQSLQSLKVAADAIALSETFVDPEKKVELLKQAWETTESITAVVGRLAEAKEQSLQRINALAGPRRGLAPEAAQEEMPQLTREELAAIVAQALGKADDIRRTRQRGRRIQSVEELGRARNAAAIYGQLTSTLQLKSLRLQAEAISPDEIKLTWDVSDLATDTRIDRFSVLRCEGDQAFAHIDDVASGDRSFVDDTVERGKIYRYKLVGLTDKGRELVSTIQVKAAH